MGQDCPFAVTGMRSGFITAEVYHVSSCQATRYLQANTRVLCGLGVVLGIGNMIGAAGDAVRRAQRRHLGAVVVIVVVTASAAQLLGVFEWMGRLLG